MDPWVIGFAVAASVLGGLIVLAGHLGRNEGPGVWERYRMGGFESTKWFPRSTPDTPDNRLIMSVTGLERL